MMNLQPPRLNSVNSSGIHYSSNSANTTRNQHTANTTYDEPSPIKPLVMRANDTADNVLSPPKRARRSNSCEHDGSSLSSYLDFQNYSSTFLMSNNNTVMSNSPMKHSSAFPQQQEQDGDFATQSKLSPTEKIDGTYTDKQKSVSPLHPGNYIPRSSSEPLVPAGGRQLKLPQQLSPLADSGSREKDEISGRESKGSTGDDEKKFLQLATQYAEEDVGKITPPQHASSPFRNDGKKEKRGMFTATTPGSGVAHNSNHPIHHSAATSANGPQHTRNPSMSTSSDSGIDYEEEVVTDIVERDANRPASQRAVWTPQVYQDGSNETGSDGSYEDDISDRSSSYELVEPLPTRTQDSEASKGAAPQQVGSLAPIQSILSGSSQNNNRPGTPRSILKQQSSLVNADGSSVTSSVVAGNLGDIGSSAPALSSKRVSFVKGYVSTENANLSTNDDVIAYFSDSYSSPPSSPPSSERNAKSYEFEDVDSDPHRKKEAHNSAGSSGPKSSGEDDEDDDADEPTLIYETRNNTASDIIMPGDPSSTEKVPVEEYQHEHSVEPVRDQRPHSTHHRQWDEEEDATTQPHQKKDNKTNRPAIRSADNSGSSSTTTTTTTTEEDDEEAEPLTEAVKSVQQANGSRRVVDNAPSGNRAVTNSSSSDSSTNSRSLSDSSSSSRHASSMPSASASSSESADDEEFAAKVVETINRSDGSSQLGDASPPDFANDTVYFTTTEQRFPLQATAPPIQDDEEVKRSDKKSEESESSAGERKNEKEKQQPSAHTVISGGKSDEDEVPARNSRSSTPASGRLPARSSAIQTAAVSPSASSVGSRLPERKALNKQQSGEDQERQKQEDRALLLAEAKEIERKRRNMQVLDEERRKGGKCVPTSADSNDGDSSYADKNEERRPSRKAAAAVDVASRVNKKKPESLTSSDDNGEHAAAAHHDDDHYYSEDGSHDKSVDQTGNTGTTVKSGDDEIFYGGFAPREVRSLNNETSSAVAEAKSRSAAPHESSERDETVDTGDADGDDAETAPALYSRELFGVTPISLDVFPKDSSNGSGGLAPMEPVRVEEEEEESSDSFDGIVSPLYSRNLRTKKSLTTRANAPGEDGVVRTPGGNLIMVAEPLVRLAEREASNGRVPRDALVNAPAKREDKQLFQPLDYEDVSDAYDDGFFGGTSAALRQQPAAKPVANPMLESKSYLNKLPGATGSAVRNAGVKTSEPQEKGKTTTAAASCSNDKGRLLMASLEPLVAAQLASEKRTGQPKEAQSEDVQFGVFVKEEEQKEREAAEAQAAREQQEGPSEEHAKGTEDDTLSPHALKKVNPHPSSLNSKVSPYSVSAPEVVKQEVVEPPQVSPAIVCEGDGASPTTRVDVGVETTESLLEFALLQRAITDRAGAEPVDTPQTPQRKSKKREKSRKKHRSRSRSAGHKDRESPKHQRSKSKRHVRDSSSREKVDAGNDEEQAASKKKKEKRSESDKRRDGKRRSSSRKRHRGGKHDREEVRPLQSAVAEAEKVKNRKSFIIGGDGKIQDGTVSFQENPNATSVEYQIAKIKSFREKHGMTHTRAREAPKECRDDEKPNMLYYHSNETRGVSGASDYRNPKLTPRNLSGDESLSDGDGDINSNTNKHINNNNNNNSNNNSTIGGRKTTFPNTGTHLEEGEVESPRSSVRQPSPAPSTRTLLSSRVGLPSGALSNHRNSVESNPARNPSRTASIVVGSKTGDNNSNKGNDGSRRNTLLDHYFFPAQLGKSEPSAQASRHDRIGSIVSNNSVSRASLLGSISRAAAVGATTAVEDRNTQSVSNMDYSVGKRSDDNNTVNNNGPEDDVMTFNASDSTLHNRNTDLLNYLRSYSNASHGRSRSNSKQMNVQEVSKDLSTFSITDPVDSDSPSAKTKEKRKKSHVAKTDEDNDSDEEAKRHSKKKKERERKERKASKSHPRDSKRRDRERRSSDISDSDSDASSPRRVEKGSKKAKKEKRKRDSSKVKTGRSKSGAKRSKSKRSRRDEVSDSSRSSSSRSRRSDASTCSLSTDNGKGGKKAHTKSKERGDRRSKSEKKKSHSPRRGKKGQSTRSRSRSARTPSGDKRKKESPSKHRGRSAGDGGGGDDNDALKKEKKNAKKHSLGVDEKEGKSKNDTKKDKTEKEKKKSDKRKPIDHPGASEQCSDSPLSRKEQTDRFSERDVREVPYSSARRPSSHYDAFLNNEDERRRQRDNLYRSFLSKEDNKSASPRYDNHQDYYSSTPTPRSYSASGRHYNGPPSASSFYSNANNNGGTKTRWEDYVRDAARTHAYSGGNEDAGKAYSRSTSATNYYEKYRKNREENKYSDPLENVGRKSYFESRNDESSPFGRNNDNNDNNDVFANINRNNSNSTNMFSPHHSDALLDSTRKRRASDVSNSESKARRQRPPPPPPPPPAPSSPVTEKYGASRNDTMNNNTNNNTKTLEDIDEVEEIINDSSPYTSENVIPIHDAKALRKFAEDINRIADSLY